MPLRSHMSRNATSALIMGLGMALISANDAIIKHVSDSVSVGQILLLRGFMICLVACLYLRFRKQPVLPPQIWQHWNVVRSVCEMFATVCFVLSLSLLALATASTLIWTSPMVLTILAALVLKETVNKGRWIAVLAGFIGICMVTQPGTDTWQWAMMLPIAAAAVGAHRDLITRYIGPGLSSMHIALSSAVFTTVAGGLLSLLSWNPLDTSSMGWLALSALLFTSGYTCFVVAIRAGDLSFVAPFSYSSILFAIVLGFVFWQEKPNTLGFAGAIVIVFAGVCIFYWEEKATSASEV